jgi:hypothetical protein
MKHVTRKTILAFSVATAILASAIVASSVAAAKGVCTGTTPYFKTDAYEYVYRVPFPVAFANTQVKIEGKQNANLARLVARCRYDVYRSTKWYERNDLVQEFGEHTINGAINFTTKPLPIGGYYLEIKCETNRTSTEGTITWYCATTP